MVVLSVGLVLFHLGVFDAQAIPRFEGLRAAGLQPVSDQVRLYSDGVMVLTVLNTRPYTLEVEWVEVSPLVDVEDVIHTDVYAVLKAGELGVFEVNSSNIYFISGASVFLLKSALAIGPEMSTTTSPDTALISSYADFHLCLKEAHSAGGQQSSNTVCGTAHNIPVLDEVFNDDCIEHGTCECETDDDCPLWCQTCDVLWTGLPTGNCDNYHDCSPYGPLVCKRTVTHPEGECVLE